MYGCEHCGETRRDGINEALEEGHGFAEYSGERG